MDVKIRNYQGIEKADLEIADGITVFIGPSDSGKSSVLRACRDFWYNREGDDHVMVGSKTAKVAVDNVIWEKGKSANRYKVDKDVYDKVGRGIVPEEVVAATNVKEVQFGDGVVRRLNVIEQFGQPFMVGDKASDNAKIIGSLSGIGIVFNALRSATADYKNQRKAQESFNRDKQAAEEELEGYGYLPDVRAKVEKIRIALERAQDIEQQRSQLVALRDRLVVAGTEAADAEKAIKMWLPITCIDIEQVDGMAEQLHKMQQLRGAYQKAQKDLDGTAQALEGLRGVAQADVEGLDDTLGQIKDLGALQAKYEAAVKSEQECLQALDIQRKKVGVEQAEYSELVAEIDVCPYSGAIMPDVCKEAIKGL